MPERQDGSKGVRQDGSESKDGRCSRRRILQISGAAVATGAVATGNAAACGQAEGSTDGGSTGGEAADSGTGDSSADRGPLGGGEGYDKVVPREEATVVVRTREELGNALSSAGSGDVVYVAGDASIDLEDSTFTVPGGVTLASNRGIDGAAGGHLHTDAETDVLTVQKDARVTGVRLQGPFYEYFDPDYYASGTGIRTVESGVEVDNCEVWGFAYGGVSVRDDAHVHHSHIHHNARDGLGYGVVAGGGHPLVEWNYFNHNRHSVASTGSHHGYTVCFNHFGPEAAGIVVDIHQPGGVHSEVHNNIVEPVDDIKGQHDPLQGVQVRGVPDESFEIYDNWFFNPNPPRDSPNGWSTEAIIQPTEDSWQNVEWRDNHYGKDADVESEDIIPGYGN